MKESRKSPYEGKKDHGKKKRLRIGNSGKIVLEKQTLPLSFDLALINDYLGECSLRNNYVENSPIFAFAARQIPHRRRRSSVL